MQKRLAQMFGILVAVLAVLGFFVEDGHLFGLMNANIVLDVLRVGLAGALLYAGFGRASDSFVHNVLAFTGVLYIGMAVLGLINSTLWGLLPSGLTGFDIIFHLGAGALATYAAFAARSHRSAGAHA
ncbi:MAG TPA: hypothetical protein VD735_04565 [Candidatus Saccharimonadales bacterium]|nr:hypothetical protein [Candidatus Saccharimonadales bacterium]